jgi:hypothetical protein
MKNIFNIAILVYCLTFLGCKEKMSPDLLKNSIQINNGTPLLENIVVNPKDFIIMDSIIIILDVYENNCLSIFDLENEILIGRFLHRGEGPNEVISPFQINRFRDTRNFDIYDVQLKRNMIFNLDSILASGILIATMKQDFLKTKNNSFHFYRICRISNDLIFGTGLILNGRYGLYNKDSNKIKTFFEYPKDGNNVKDEIKSMAYQSDLGMSIDGKKIVSTTRTGAILEILDVQNPQAPKKEKEHIFFYPKYKPDYMSGGGVGIIPDKKMKRGFLSVSTTNDHIYTLFSGRSYEKYGSEALKGNSIIVFDWKGNPIKTLKLPEDVSNFCVNLNGDFLFCLVHNPNPKIIKYEIPN